jgi:hypothetical protein
VGSLQEHKSAIFENRMKKSRPALREEWNINPDEAYMRSVVTILTRKPTPNTYKFAVIRALADGVLGRRFSGNDPIVSGVKSEVVSFEQIAKRIVGYYWHIVTDFRLRQSIDPVDEPNVMQLIRDENADLALKPHLEYWRYLQEYPERHDSLVARCCDPRSSLIKTISRLNTVTYYLIDPKLFEVRGRDIHLKKSAVEFLIRYQQTVAQLAIGNWVSFTEQLTSSPRLYYKIGGDNPGTSALWNENQRRKYSQILDELWGAVCFYCGRTSVEAPLAVGRAIPLMYVYQDRFWNLVLNCDTCSAAKGEQTPPDFCVERLIARNRELLSLIERSDRGLGKRDIHELNHYGSGIAEHIRGLIQGSRADGFSTWSGPECVTSK